MKRLVLQSNLFGVGFRQNDPLVVLGDFDRVFLGCRSLKSVLPIVNGTSGT